MIPVIIDAPGTVLKDLKRGIGRTLNQRKNETIHS